MGDVASNWDFLICYVPHIQENANQSLHQGHDLRADFTSPEILRTVQFQPPLRDCNTAHPAQGNL